MAAVRASLLVSAFIGLSLLLAAAPAPVTKPRKPETREGTFARLQQRLARLGVTWSRLRWDGDRGLWEFECHVPLPGRRDAWWPFEATSTDVDGLGAVVRTALAVEEHLRHADPNPL